MLSHFCMIYAGSMALNIAVKGRGEGRGEFEGSWHSYHARSQGPVSSSSSLPPKERPLSFPPPPHDRFAFLAAPLREDTLVVINDQRKRGCQEWRQETLKFATPRASPPP